jgi:hypothetical protein
LSKDMAAAGFHARRWASRAHSAAPANSALR